MATLLVDTNIVSYADNEHGIWQRYEPLVAGHTLLIAAQTVAELRYGALAKNWGERRRTRLELLMGAYTVAYPNDAICTGWAEVRVSSRQKGRPISPADAWIAATALAFEVPLVTHNEKDFDLIDSLKIISEHT